MRWDRIEIWEASGCCFHLQPNSFFSFLLFFNFNPSRKRFVDDTLDFGMRNSLGLSLFVACTFLAFPLSADVSVSDCSAAWKASRPRDLCYFQDRILMFDGESKHSCSSRVWNLIKFRIEEATTPNQSPSHKCCYRVEKHLKLGIKAGWKTLDDVSFHTLDSPSCLSEIDVHKFS